MAKKRRVLLTTLIIVGEGIQDQAFLRHMKNLYDSQNGQKINLDSADGGSPSDIIQSTIRKNRHKSYDKKYILIDSDIPILPKDRVDAKNNNIILIESTPFCLEGMLLDVLNKKIPHTSQLCKKSLHKLLDGSASDSISYQTIFTKNILDNTNKEQIKTLIKVIENK